MDVKFDYLIIDAGNTVIKVAVVEQLKFKLHFFEEIEKCIDFCKKLGYKSALLSSVRSEIDTQKLLNNLPRIKDIKSCLFPIKLDYKTPETLGVDRIANVCAANNLTTNSNCLVIDIGTCIKYDFISNQGVYFGGAISPGIKLRYKALNQFTGALPLLDNKEKVSMEGKSTNECLHSGVINGIRGELNHFMEYYEQKYSNLTIFMTGGDAKYFDYSSKNNIFANENLTIEGLLQILLANAI